MIPTSRRTFLQFLTSAAAAATFPRSIDRALAIPAHHRTGTIRDVEHIVILMQENRAFDHYFGTLRGVRGFGDPRPMTTPSGQPVWFQPDGAGVTLPFLVDTAHGWFDQHAAWNNGRYDQWIAAKETNAVMAFYNRQDIPFFYSLADAFTICDAYHCSLQGPTDPNRYHMWTGWVGNDGKAGGPVINNAEAFSEHGNWPANYGAWYVSQVLDALTSNPEVWSKTAFFLTYDENDGFFDHIVPPTPPFQGRGRSTVGFSNEIFPGSPGNPTWPYGLGFRVPMIVISPWSKGGWVCSEVFDHTSLIQFIERRFATGRNDLIESKHHGLASHGLRRSHQRLRFRTPERPPSQAAGHDIV